MGEGSALFPRPLYRGPVAKRITLAAGHVSLRSVKKILSHIESPTWLCALFPSARVLRFSVSDSHIRLLSAARRLHRAEVLYGEPVPLPEIILADNHERARPLEP